MKLAEKLDEKLDEKFAEKLAKKLAEKLANAHENFVVLMYCLAQKFHAIGSAFISLLIPPLHPGLPNRSFKLNMRSDAIV